MGRCVIAACGVLVWVTGSLRKLQPIRATYDFVGGVGGGGV